MRIPLLLLSIAIAGLLSGLSSPGIAAEQTDNGFQDVLSLAGIDTQDMAKVSNDVDITNDDWQTLAQIVYRLRQFSPAQLQGWAISADEATLKEKMNEPLGQLLAISATVISVEAVDPPEELASETVLPNLYRCRFQFDNSAIEGIALVPRVPTGWEKRLFFEEPVRLLGVALGNMPDGEGEVSLLLTTHLAWYPVSGVSVGQLLLARQGMDVALLDEVKHRKPFVKPGVSREGEAFYQTLAALSDVDHEELASLSKQSVAAAAEQWSARKPDFQQRRSTLSQQVAAANDATKRKSLQRELDAASRDLAIATAVEQQALRNLSSVAPMYLQPESQAGELVRIEGIARRAIRIAMPKGDSPANASDKKNLEAYYEMEVFTADSQDLPVVCCVSRLPNDFPVGDEIREPVRVAGVFFKSWRYVTRKNKEASGETDQQQRMYTPIVVSGEPILLPAAKGGQSIWGFWGGIAFLAVLVIFWFTMFRRAELDRRQRAATQPARLDDLSPEQ
jgi:hypothetical protein